MPLDTKVRYRLGWILLVLPLLFNVALGSAPKCDKTPLGQEAQKTPGENGFYVTVAGSPRLYRPGQVYTVSLAGMRMDEGDIEPKKVKFIDFMIVAESNLPSTEVSGLGTFQTMPGDAMSKFRYNITGSSDNVPQSVCLCFELSIDISVLATNVAMLLWQHLHSQRRRFMFFGQLQRWAVVAST